MDMKSKIASERQLNAGCQPQGRRMRIYAPSDVENTEQLREKWLEHHKEKRFESGGGYHARE